MLETKTNIDKQLVKELSRKSFIVSLIVGVGGIIACIPFLILLIIDYKNILYTIFYIIFFVLGAVGLYNLFAVINKCKKVLKSNSTLLIKLDDKITVTPFQDGQQKSDLNFNYNDVIYYKETHSYIYLYLNRKSSFPIKKDEQFDVIMDLLKQKGIKNI